MDPKQSIVVKVMTL